MQHEIDDDTTVMLRLKQGDRSAFDELYARFSKRVYNYVLRYVGSTYASEDITQEVFVKMYTAAKTYEPTARFSTWLFTIATNLSINEFHKNRRTEQLDDNVLRDDGLPVEEKVALHDMEQGLLQSIDRLPGQQRAAILLRTYENMDYEEIADVLHVSVKAVKSLLSRARGRLLDEYKTI